MSAPRRISRITATFYNRVVTQACYGPGDLPEQPLSPPGVYPYTRGTGEVDDPPDPISFSGYEMREQGATAVQELAFTFSRAIDYVERALADGVPIDDIAPRFEFTFSAQDNFFEEIAKFRAARTLWATIMRDRFQAGQGENAQRSLKIRIHARTASCVLTMQQTDSNIIRTTLHAMAAVLGGAQSLDGESAERIRQVIEYESGMSDVPDAFGGSYFLERLTADIESGVREYMGRGVDAAQEIGRSRDEFRRQVEAGEAVFIGVNRFVEQSEPKPAPKQPNQ